MSQRVDQGSSVQKTYKIIVVGDSGVGKSCLTNRYVYGVFPNDVEATIGVDFREKIVVVDDDKFKLQIWDTAGQERFRRNMVNHYYRNVHAIVYVFDISNRESFTSLSYWISQTKEHCGSIQKLNSSSTTEEIKIPSVIVGNKADLKTDRQVTEEDIMNFCNAQNLTYFEISAKKDASNEQIDGIFTTIAINLKDIKPLLSKPSISTKRRDRDKGCCN